MSLSLTTVPAGSGGRVALCAGFSATPAVLRWWYGCLVLDDIRDYFEEDLLPYVNVFPYPEINVVYELWTNSGDDVAYIGSTKNFNQRLRTHLRDKDVALWHAWPCDSRKHACEVEKKMIKIHEPFLNKVWRP